ncbi:DUF2599 domain-containing protein [Nocardia farcinica]|uniref:Protein of uncharacterized function (DUF2599) n=1 Tax=Nocardia farcinica TaxID=37329 RepID=A0A0H5NJP4_NOCFR|nr:DUF2599 domain-containing protein [Nocardia farcinica]AXK84900.1 DUF2599 domain-containing protein [Nocardia farcinica]MBF6141062.1 DUF2599 domain-containing protein [Nocardia farcinica]MBF6249644.1 DUF2599 domain-containing protein [Nocardia farcinica]MBF6267337.1 DUF2599 domain-containing protein [Nocardia farcinica]MBF6441436.1 DUF2599 domain-containing protein [Nocardia farcinica]
MTLRRPAGRRAAAVLAPLALAALLTGCGDDQPAAAPPATATTPRPPTTATPPPVAALPTIDPYADVPLIDRVEWTDTVDGDRLLVVPTRAGRDTTFPGAENRAWAEIVALSPAADSPGMRDQFVCHWHWARLVQPDKPSWNLEPWRPAVGYQETVRASCNPGGPER